MSDSAVFSAYEDYRGFDPASPERNLMIAILRAAVDDMTKNGSRRQEALSFFMNDDDYYIYSFVSICDHLDVCPRRIRKQLGLQRSA